MVVPADRLRRVIDRVLAAPAYQQQAPEDPWAPVRRAWTALFQWIDALRDANPGAYTAFVWSLVAVLLLVVAHAAWVAARTIRAGTARAPGDVTEVTVVARDATWYAREAQRLAAESRYAEAMQADFLRLVLELDGRQVARFHPSKTPIEYVREASMGEEARRAFRDLTRTLYTHAFARVPATAETWTQWRTAASTDRYASAH